ncbi:biotin--[acetyl-CoA-carboxylase] ligase [Zoogloea sp.]|uniref:biotin--[acetyl-CoA-carboxylase] ligase n=1 Tax=Zoogloea sp. TaxID=49181 RepID=UPI0035B1B3EC
MDHPNFEPLSRAEVAAALGSLADAFSVELLPECDSTNSCLLADPPPDDGRIPVLAADRQTAGRGRRGRVWQSWPGAGLTFSLQWRFAPGGTVPPGLSLVVGLAVARTLEALGVEGVQLKWPNDVLVHGHKIAGILIELVSGRGRPSAAVIGVGINLRLPPEAAIESALGVTDLARCLDAPPAGSRLLGLVLAQLHRLLGICAEAGFEPLRGAWQQRNAFAELPVQILGEAEPLAGTCVGVDSDGALLLQTSEGLRRVLSGDVSLRLA